MALLRSLLIPITLLCPGVLTIIGQEHRAASGPPDYLFVIETSLESQEYRENQIHELGRHIATGLGGAMLDGQTFAVWTADATVQTGDFPTRTWTQSNARALAADVVGYAASRKPVHEANWPETIRTVFSAIKGAGEINILVYSIPGHVLRGTPFDNRIDYFLNQNGKELLVFKSPIVTALKGRDQRIIGLSVNAKGDPVELFQEKRSLFEMVGGQSNPLLTSNSGTPVQVSRNPLIMRGDDVISVPRPDPASLAMAKANQASLTPLADADAAMAEKNEAATQEPLPIEPSTNALIRFEIAGETDQSSEPAPSPVNDDSDTADIAAGPVRSGQPDGKSGASRAKSGFGVLEVRARELNSSDEEKPPAAEVATIGATGPRSLYLSLGISSILIAFGFIVLAFRVHISRGPSLITEAYLLDDHRKNR